MIKKDRLLKLTQKVISYNSENPPGNELALAKFIEKDMRTLKLDVKIYTYAKDRPNIIATLRGTLPRKQAAKEAILLTPHFDTVPIGQGWKYKPLGGQISGGKLYGRGSTDDKGNLASCMEVMRSLVEDKVRLRKDVVMAATVDEETGSHYGIIPLLEKKILKPRLALVMDSTEFDAVIAQKGLLHGRIQIFGKKAHGAYNWRGVNAIEKAAPVITNLINLQFKYKKHPLLHGPTMNIGVIKGGDKVNMVSDFCEFAFDHRFMPGMNPNEILKKIRSAVRKVTTNFKIKIDDIQMPYEIKKDHPHVKLFLNLARTMKCPAVAKGSEGATVITFFQKHKIAAFATGFGAHGTAHTNDEYIYVKSLYSGTKFLEQYIKEYDQL
ncbi:MAG: ArgE/DapE family deacylase [Candidatus Omnitrophica bacterium]|nr:ArgE/DapE family deacylase [Candidatus Omnitrophota bacterium]MCB9746916.1 ArgE/DapE family deacylase [Candidatus Omnitrophota bacterium]